MKVNCYRCRHSQGAKGAVRLQPKGNAAGCFNAGVKHMDTNGCRHKRQEPPHSCCSYGTGKTRHFALSRAGILVRGADEVPGMGVWRKPKPLGNRVDRSCNITPPRKRADFQMVRNYENARRTFSRRKSK
jgi:hypothetical protein